MTLNLMSLATVKVYLGLAVTTYDASITAMLPIVSADVRSFNPRSRMGSDPA